MTDDERLAAAYATLRRAIDGSRPVAVDRDVALALHTALVDATMRASRAGRLYRDLLREHTALTDTWRKREAQLIEQVASVEAEIARLRGLEHAPRNGWVEIAGVWHIAGAGCGEAVGLEPDKDAPPVGTRVCPGCMGFGR